MTKRTMRDVKNDMTQVLDEAWRLGYAIGARDGQQRLEMLASVVPSSVTKQWLIEEAGRQAAAMRKGAK